MIRVVELFAGIGAQRMALTLAGIPYKVVAISEIDRHALASYEAIWGDVMKASDNMRIIKELRNDSVTLDIFIAVVTGVIGSLINGIPYYAAAKDCERLSKTKTNPCEAHAIRALSYK